MILQHGRVDLRYNPLPVRKNTKIALLDGRTVSIEELAKEYNEGKTNWVYSIQDKTKRVVPGKVTWCGKNYVCNNLHRVWLDDKSYIDTAPEHPFVMRDGTSKRADELVAGDSLMPLYRDINNRGYERCYNIESGEYETTHSLVARDVYKEKWENTEKRVVHHKIDLGPPNKRNNRPDRLEVLNFFEHAELHAKHAELTLNNPEMLGKRSQRFKEYNKTKEHSLVAIETNKKYKKAQKMGENYNGTELHKSHNEVRREAQLESWKNKKTRSDAMQWIIPNDVVEFVFNEIKKDKSIGREDLSKKIRQNDYLMTLLKEVNSDNNRDVSKFHVNAVVAKLLRNGFLNTNSYTEFKNFASDNNAPLNHQVTKVEVLNESDDVYCMTVVGPNNENDRHNFATLPLTSNEKSCYDGVFLLNSVDEDYYIPVRDQRSSRIETLSGGQFTRRY